uniref:4-hydroxy-tetrahydrodipicolinate synthase n=1 Tax=mine drainage metagenome TaxID=410659 RepID=E6PVT5_9ZZZZ
MSAFTGIWVPLVTPFTTDGTAVDHAALHRLVQHLSAAGVSGLAALGTTGEPSALDEAEKDAVLDTVLAAAGKTPVAAGLAGNNAAHLRASVRRMNARRLAGLLVPAPYYIRPGQDGIRRHFLDLADLSDHPLIVYDIPYRTGVQIDTETMLALAAHPRIRAVKDCGGSPDKTLALILDGRMQILAGEDLQIFSTLCLGGSGAIAASAHLHTARFVALHQAVSAGRLAEAREHFHGLAPFIRALFSEPNPGPVKAALAAQGLMHDTVRAPMSCASKDFRTHWARLLQDAAAQIAVSTSA